MFAVSPCEVNALLHAATAAVSRKILFADPHGLPATHR
jgi:hypothetical protein